MLADAFGVIRSAIPPYGIGDGGFLGNDPENSPDSLQSIRQSGGIENRCTNILTGYGISNAMKFISTI